MQAGREADTPTRLISGLCREVGRGYQSCRAILPGRYPHADCRSPLPRQMRPTELASSVRDHNGLTVAYVYYELRAGTPSSGQDEGEVGRVAVNIAKLPDLLRR